jgi:uncharacterized protein YbjT (DUF2867 family)
MGFKVRGLSNSGGPSADGIETIAVDLTSADNISRSVEGASVVVLTIPQDYRDGVRQRLTETVTAAAAKAGAERLVVNLGGTVFDGYDRPISTVLRDVREIARTGRTPAVSLEPTVYMDNLLAPWSLPSIVNQGVFAYPIRPELKLNWLSHDDLARFAVAAASSSSAIDGKSFRIGGPEAISGLEMARELTSHLGQTVQYAAVPLADFAAALNSKFGAPMGDDIADLYRYLHDNPDALARTPSDWAGLDVKPEAFRTWVARQDWGVTP